MPEHTKCLGINIDAEEYLEAIVKEFRDAVTKAVYRHAGMSGRSVANTDDVHQGAMIVAESAPEYIPDCDGW